MKTIKLTLGFIFTMYLTSFSQITYDSVASESKIWSTLSGGFGVEMVECCYQTTFVKFEIDPLINTIDEKQVLLSTDSLKTWTKVGNVKESDKKIYFRDLENNQGLIYDFGATEGSIIYLVNYYNDYYEDTMQVRIEKIDTVNYQGKDRRRFEIIYNSGRIDYWIEGIGSIKGILNSCLILDGGFRELLCVYDKNLLIYQNEERGVCFLEDDYIKPIADFDFYILVSYPIQIDLESTAKYADSIVWKAVSNYSLTDTIIGTGESLRIQNPYKFVVLAVDCMEPPCPSTIDITQIVFNDCGKDSVTKAVPVENYTAVQLVTSDLIKCYPNPSTGYVCIDFNERANDLDYKIIDCAGQLIDSGILKNSKVRINLKTGLYILRINEKDKLIYENKIIITK